MEKLTYSQLPAMWTWVFYHTQLWRKLAYSLGINSLTFEEMIYVEMKEGDMPGVEG